jgi:hypothetical protein
LGGALVIVSSLVVELVRSRGALRLDKEKRADDRRLGLDQFQRETLLALQDAALQLVSRVGAKQVRDFQAADQSGMWPEMPEGDELVESVRHAARVLDVLRSRLEDEELRALTSRLDAAAIAVNRASSADASRKARTDLSNMSGAMIERSGEVIRASYIRERTGS